MKVLFSDSVHICLIHISVSILEKRFLGNRACIAEIGDILFQDIIGIHKPLLIKSGCIGYSLHMGISLQAVKKMVVKFGLPAYFNHNIIAHILVSQVGGIQPRQYSVNNYE